MAEFSEIKALWQGPGGGASMSQPTLTFHTVGDERSDSKPASIPMPAACCRDGSWPCACSACCCVVEASSSDDTPSTLS